MKRIYIASPYTKGDRGQNVHRQIVVWKMLAEAGYYPFSPLLSHHIALTYEKDKPLPFWLNQDFAWLDCCHLFIRLTGYSRGADLEEAYAVDHKIPILYVPIDSDVLKSVNEFFKEQIELNLA